MDPSDLRLAIIALSSAVIFLFGLVAAAWRRCESDRARIWEYLCDAATQGLLPAPPPEKRKPRQL